MAGFGSAFAQSFNQANEARARHKEDLFKLQFQNFISQNEKRQEWDRENKKNVEWAKSAVRLAGQPIETWGEAYKLKSAGMDDDDIMKLLKENTATITPAGTTAGDTSGPADPRDDLTQSAESSVNAQMAQSGMAPPAPGGGLFGKIKDVLNPNSQSRMQRDSLKSQQQIADVTGVSLQDVQDTLSGKARTQSDIPGLDDFKVTWTAKNDIGKPDLSKVNNFNDAIAAKTWFDLNGGSEAEKKMAETLYNNYLHSEHDKAKLTGGNFFEPSRGILKGPDGNPTKSFVFRTEDGAGNAVWKTSDGKIVQPDQIYPYNENMEKEIDKAGGDIQKSTEEYTSGVNNLQQMARTSTELAALAQKMPQALDLSGNITQTADRFIRGVKGIGTILTGKDLFDKYGGQLSAQDIDSWKQDMGTNISKLDQAEAEASDILQRTGDAAYAAIIMDIKATKLAYMYAATSGQTGRGVTQNEFDNFKAAAMGNGNPEAIKTAAGDFIREQYKILKQKEVDINHNSESIRRFEAQYPGMPFPYQPVVTLDELLKGDADLKSQIDAAMGDKSEDEIGKIQLPAGITPKILEEEGLTSQQFNNLSEKGKALIKRKYGAQ